MEHVVYGYRAAVKDQFMDPQIYVEMREVEDKHWWFVGRRSIIKRVLSSLGLPGRVDILDVGCGTGGNLSLLSEFGRVTGVELCDYAIGMALARKICKVCKGSLPDDMPFSPQSFDLIMCVDVLEHIDDDFSSLITLKSLLRPKGYLVITVPAFPFLWSHHDEQHHHKRRYLGSTLAQLIREAQLKLEHLTYYNTWLFPIAAGIRLSSRLFLPKKVGNDMGLPNPMINRALQSVFRSERHFVAWARIPFGLSLLAIARNAP